MTWDQWLAIHKQPRQSDEPPTACPNDGTPLSPDEAGLLHCQFDGYTWPEQ